MRVDVSAVSFGLLFSSSSIVVFVLLMGMIPNLPTTVAVRPVAHFRAKHYTPVYRNGPVPTSQTVKRKGLAPNAHVSSRSRLSLRQKGEIFKWMGMKRMVSTRSRLGSGGSKQKLGQSLNMDAIRSLWRAFTNPSLLVPHMQCLNVGEVPFEQLRAAGIKAIVFDKDNTLTAPYSLKIHPVVAPAVQQCLSIFHKNAIIMSNSAGTLDDALYAEAQEIEAALGMHVLRHREKKPRGFEELMSHFEDLNPSEICFIGDRLLTDILFGSLHGLYTIHVSKALDTKNDNSFARIIRSVENNVIVRLLRWMGIRPKFHPISSEMLSHRTR